MEHINIYNHTTAHFHVHKMHADNFLTHTQTTPPQTPYTHTTTETHTHTHTYTHSHSCKRSYTNINIYMQHTYTFSYTWFRCMLLYSTPHFSINFCHLITRRRVELYISHRSVSHCCYKRKRFEKRYVKCREHAEIEKMGKFRNRSCMKEQRAWRAILIILLNSFIVNSSCFVGTCPIKCKWLLVNVCVRCANNWNPNCGLCIEINREETKQTGKKSKTAGSL